VIFSDDFAIITTVNSGLRFDPIRDRKSKSQYMISKIQFEQCANISHVFCFAHLTIGKKALECNRISDNAGLIQYPWCILPSDIQVRIVLDIYANI